MRTESATKSLNHYLRMHGLGGLDEPGTLAQMAYHVRDHAHFCQLLHRCEPLLKRQMYEAMSPYLRFKAKSLDDYIADMAREAERRKLPAFDQTTGNLVPYEDYVPGGKVMPLERLAEKAIHDTEAMKLAGGHVLTVTCHKCTSQADFKGATQVSATIEARRAGWVYQEIDGKGVEICPKCPSARPGTKTGNA